MCISCPLRLVDAKSTAFFNFLDYWKQRFKKCSKACCTLLCANDKRQPTAGNEPLLGFRQKRMHLHLARPDRRIRDDEIKALRSKYADAVAEAHLNVVEVVPTHVS